MPPQPISDQENKYLLTLPAIRERCQMIYDQVTHGHSKYLKVHPENLKYCVDWVVETIQHQYGHVDSILPHTRWRHYQTKVGDAQKGTVQSMEIDRIEMLLETWTAAHVDKREQAKRVIDLMTVSVLLDAGAGDIWKYKDTVTGTVFHRSEGIAIAVYNLFIVGAFSSQNELQPCQVDAIALKQITVESLKKGFQVSEHNPLVGLENRCQMLQKLSHALINSSYFQTKEDGVVRPGNMIDALLGSDQPIPRSISLYSLWPVLLSLRGVSDVFYCELVGAWVPFHKLSQWLAYTYSEVFVRLLGVAVTPDTPALRDSLTGLAEYRNGGLLLDTQVLTTTTGGADTDTPNAHGYPVDHPLIVEWRACTVVLLDRIAEAVRERLHAPSLGLDKVLEGGTWKAGREIAKKIRPESGSPPIHILSDGTVF